MSPTRPKPGYPSRYRSTSLACRGFKPCLSHHQRQCMRRSPLTRIHGEHVAGKIATPSMLVAKISQRLQPLFWSACACLRIPRPCLSEVARCSHRLRLHAVGPVSSPSDDRGRKPASDPSRLRRTAWYGAHAFALLWIPTLTFRRSAQPRRVQLRRRATPTRRLTYGQSYGGTSDSDSYRGNPGQHATAWPLIPRCVMQAARCGLQDETNCLSLNAHVGAIKILNACELETFQSWAPGAQKKSSEYAGFPLDLA